MNYNKYMLSLLLGILLLSSSCKKYLEAKSDDKLSTPGTLADIQAILDSYLTLNQAQVSLNSSSDEYYLSDDDWLAVYELVNKDAYIWDSNTQDDYDWNTQYTAIYYANSALDNMEHISPGGQEKTWNEIKGAALFFRSYAFFQLSQTYAPPYNISTAKTDPGIPLRLNSNFNIVSKRASVQQTYDQIIHDLKQSLSLLPENALFKTRPGKSSAFALLAKVYLIMGDYANAKLNADSSLQLYNTLIDFNNLDTMSSNPIKRFNEEVLFYTNTGTPNNANSSIAKVDSALYNMFEINDLRKNIFFRSNADGSHAFKSSYNGSISRVFNGLATDEVYLTRAEALARENKVPEALNDLNTLLEKRWKAGTYTPISNVNADELLLLILKERRKELIYRGTRWMDLRRLNLDQRFAITLTRTINGTIYILPPNDPRYTFLIPNSVIDLTGMPQNKH